MYAQLFSKMDTSLEAYDITYGITLALHITGWCLATKQQQHAKSLQLYPTLCNPKDYSPSGSSVHGILQARILEWVAMPFSRTSSWPQGQTPVSCISCIGNCFFFCFFCFFFLPLLPPGKPPNSNNHRSFLTPWRLSALVNCLPCLKDEKYRILILYANKV